MVIYDESDSDPVMGMEKILERKLSMKVSKKEKSFKAKKKGRRKPKQLMTEIVKMKRKKQKVD